MIIQHRQITIECPIMLMADGSHQIIWPSFKLPNRPYPVFVYLYAAALYLSSDESMRAVAQKVINVFGLETFSHTTICRFLQKLYQTLPYLIYYGAQIIKEFGFSKSRVIGRKHWDEFLALGFGIGAQRTIASLRRTYETAAEKIAPSAFYYRFNGGLTDFLKECLIHGIANLASHTSLTLSDKIQGFKDFHSVAHIVISRTLKYAGIDDDPTMFLLFLTEEGVDPNVHRKRLLSSWVKANSQGLNTSK